MGGWGGGRKIERGQHRPAAVAQSVKRVQLQPVAKLSFARMISLDCWWVDKTNGASHKTMPVHCNICDTAVTGSCSHAEVVETLDSSAAAATASTAGCWLVLVRCVQTACKSQIFECALEQPPGPHGQQEPS
jgi:hypothetical protein